jgi:hypothetical protein
VPDVSYSILLEGDSKADALSLNVMIREITVASIESYITYLGSGYNTV